MVPGYVIVLSHGKHRCPHRATYEFVPARCEEDVCVRHFSATHNTSLQCLLFHAVFSPPLCHTCMTVTNVVFSNGRLDPWSEMGVVDQDLAGAGVKIIMMDQAAHHLDLFFEHPLDPKDVLDARRVEMDMVETWVDQAYRAYGGESASRDPSGGDGNVVGTGAGRPDAEAHEGVPSWLERVPSLTADW